METKRYVPHALMGRYLAGHAGEGTLQELFASAVDYFVATDQIWDEITPFPYDCDVILTSDEEFIRLCDNLPVDVSRRENPSFQLADNMFAPDYDCFVLRHLNGLPLDVHNHDFFEIAYIWSGSCVHTTCEQTITLTAGDVLIIPPNLSHSIEPQSEDTVLFNILVRPRAFHSKITAFLSRGNAISSFFSQCLWAGNRVQCLLLHTDNGFALKRIIKHLCQECYLLQSVFCDFATDLLGQLLCYLILAGEVDSSYMGLPDHFTLMQLMLFIQQNYRTVTLKSLASHFFFTEEHLSRLIKKVTGKTFSAILREARMNQSRLLLSRTSYSLETISELVGYSDAASFSRAFKAESGYTPVQYRKRFAE